MANITITVQSLLNTAVYDSYTIDNGQTVDQLKIAVNSARGFDSSWYNIVLNQHVVSGSATLASLGIVTGTVLRTANVIDRLATKELKQRAKLDLAALDRDASTNPRSTYDLTLLPTQFDSNAVINNPNAGGLVVGRPWIATVSTFTFFEAFGTTATISTTQYVSGNKIYAESSTFDVPGVPNSRVVVNDIEVLNVGNGVDRGHHLVVLDSNGNLISATRYDTFETAPGDGGAPGRAALNSALNSVATGNIIVLVVYDASSFDATLRSTINTGYGSTNSNTWTSSRISHIFIGVKV